MAAPVKHMSKYFVQGCRGASWRRTSSRWLLTTKTLLEDASAKETGSFNENILEHICCPLSKKPLRYDRGNCQLVCDDIGVAYPIVNGIPNLIPADARMIKTDKPLQPDSQPV
ncbi:protein preY, mitochondrial-like [Haliotis rufescens]|uniref:protein preY, mitochondrial-like n=1 Tax=Haliotis rufescens TaxID=6454 RepID=UPI00201E9573|nr:protein preY, mitochondrial-like [Haliotis rufescens]